MPHYSVLGLCVGLRWGLALVTTKLQHSSDPDPAGLWVQFSVGGLCFILHVCEAKLLWLSDCVLQKFAGLN